MSKKRYKSRKVRQRLWLRLFGTSSIAHCYWCDKPLTFNESTVDHEPPLAEGGNRNQGVIACYDCNHERGKKTFNRVRVDDKNGTVQDKSQQKIERKQIDLYWEKYLGI